MDTKILLDLQLFGGEGAAGDGGGDGATGVTGAAEAAAPVPEEQRLRELGVPEHVLAKRANRKSAKRAAKAAQVPAAETDTTMQQDAVPQVPTAEQTEPTQEPTETDAAPAASPRLTWDEIMADPEYNKQMQAAMNQRLRSAKTAEENLNALAPALELLAKKHGMTMEGLDYAALAEAVSNDDQYYEDLALEQGTSVEEAKRKDRQQRDTARQEAQRQRTAQEQAFAGHIAELERQGNALKQKFPNFDLRKELQDPRFARMTAPGGGLSVEDAYYAIHRAEIQAAERQAAEQQAASRMADTIRSNGKRPAENGVSGKAPSVTTFDYKNATKQQRAELKKAIYAAQARGEKLYPGQKY